MTLLPLPLPFSSCVSPRLFEDLPVWWQRPLCDRKLLEAVDRHGMVYRDILEDPSLPFYEMYSAACRIRYALEEAKTTNPDYAAALQGELMEKQAQVLSEKVFNKYVERRGGRGGRGGRGSCWFS